MSPLASVGIVLLFVLVGGFFAAAEIALVSLRESQVTQLAQRGSRGRAVQRLHQHPNRFLSSVQIGVTFAGFLSAAFGASTIADDVTPQLESWGMSAGVASAVSLVAITFAFGMFNRGVEFFVETDVDQATLQVRARGNLSAEEKRSLVLEVERRVIGTPGVKGFYTLSGTSGGGRGNAPVDTIGNIYIELEPYKDRGPSKPIMNALRKRVENLPGMYVELSEFQSGPPTGKAIQIEIGSENYAALDRVTAAVRAQGV